MFERSILILASPRTGSNLLIDSLARHPFAKTGGEYLTGKRLQLNTNEAIRNIRSGGCNLFKVFSYHQSHPMFQSLVRQCELRIYLHRRDKQAQYRSLVRAWETGCWCGGNVQQTEPKPCPVYFGQLSTWDRRNQWYANHSISYERLVDDWDSVTAEILRRARWSPMSMSMAREKIQPKEQPHGNEVVAGL